jgi:hypothetical protein
MAQVYFALFTLSEPADSNLKQHMANKSAGIILVWLKPDLRVNGHEAHTALLSPAPASRACLIKLVS